MIVKNIVVFLLVGITYQSCKMIFKRNTEGDLAEARWQRLSKIGVDTLIKVEDVLYTKYYRTNYLFYKQEGKGFMECYYRNVLNADKRKFGRIHKIGPIPLDIDTILNYYHKNGDKIKSAKFEFRYYSDSRSGKIA